MNSQTEENYLKAIYSCSKNQNKSASTNAIADYMQTKASSVTDMIKKLSDKKLVDYQKYKGVKLTKSGKKMALSIIRKHRLWEVFLVEKLNFTWDEVHDIAEQLEHIKSPKLTNRLDEFLNFPKFDPHGDPIPDQEGIITHHTMSCPISEMNINDKGIIVGVNDSSADFLQYLDTQNLTLGIEVELINIQRFDKNRIISANNQKINISEYSSNQIIIKKS